MAGICGWTAMEHDFPVGRILDAMSAGLPPSGELCPAWYAMGSGLQARLGVDGLFTEDETGDVLAIMGRIRWSGGRYARRDIVTTLLHACRIQGVSVLEGLAGNFSLVYADPHNRVVLLAVDRMGIQPLYYAMTAEGGVVFASSLESLRHHPSLHLQVDAQAIYDYIYFHVIPSPGSIYRDVYKLEPGQYLMCRDGAVEVGRYWQPHFEEGERHEVKVTAEELRQTLWQAVRRCEPDSATGAFLSGGTDSSAITGILTELAGRPAPAYSIGFSADGYDEISYARIAARHFGSAIHEYYVTPDDVATAIPLVARAYDEPFGNASAVPVYFCALRASETGVHTLLAGDGGDELFGGNERYATQKMFELYGAMLPQGMRHHFVEPLLSMTWMQGIFPLRKLARYVEQARIPMPARMQTYGFLHRMSPSEVFTEDFISRIDPGRPLHMLEETYARAPSSDVVNRMLYLDWKFTLADNDLRKVNRMCESAGVRVLYPMLDDDLVAFSTRIPPSEKVKGFRLRHFYKEALRDFLPAAVIHKRKHGFGLPFGVWLENSPPLQALLHNNLESLRQRGIIRPEFLRYIVQAHRREHAAYYGTLLWIFLMLEQWFQEHRVAL